MPLTASSLRADIYRILDEVLRTGQPAEIERGGKRLQIIAVEPPSRLEALEPRKDLIVGDPEDLIHLDWYTEWKP